jgi:hypothetical protein
VGKIRPGRCVHCLASVDEITDDHLFPRSWYPSTTPKNLEKWKLPACLPCNREYGRIEEELRLKLAACLDPKSEAAAGIWQKVRDSLNPSKGRSPLDKFKRNLARKRFLAGVMPARKELLEHTLPELDPNRPMGNLALRVDGRRLRKFIEKLVRGTIYLTEQRYIEADQEITVSLLRREHEGELIQILEQSGELLERGLGIRIRKAVAHDGVTNALFVFDVWGQFRFYGMVMDRDLA